jgi:hypothetical protein
MKLVSPLLFLLTTVCAMAADLPGKWKAATEGPNGEMVIVFTFKLDGKKITGTAEGQMGTMPITEGTLEGDAIEFTVATDQFKVVHKGTVSGDEMKLKVDIGERSMEMTAKRQKP